MKKLFGFILLFLSFFSFSNDKVIKVAAAGFPMSKIVEIAKEDLEKKGYSVEIKVLTDYVTANKGLAAKEFDANFHQHEPFMEIFNEKNAAKLVKVDAIYDAYVGFYGKKLKNKNEISNDMKVAIPNDPTNKSRALKILADEGLIKLKTIASKALYTTKDIISNPKNLNIVELAIPALGAAYDEFDLVFNWPAHVLRRGLTPEKDALFLEKRDKGTFAIILASREDNKNSQKIKDLAKAMKSEKVKKFLMQEYSEQGYPVF